MVAISDDVDPLRSSLDRHLAQCGAKFSLPLVPEKEKNSHIGQIREAHGLCRSCGQQLYKIEVAQTGFFSCCFGKDEDDVRKVRLTIPGRVENGVCLTCKTNVCHKSSTFTTESNTFTVNTSSCFSRFGEVVSYFFGHTSTIMQRETPCKVVPRTTRNPSPLRTTPHSTPPESKISLPDSKVTSTLSSLPANDNSAVKTSAQWLPSGTPSYRGPYNESGERHGGEGEMVWAVSLTPSTLKKRPPVCTSRFPMGMNSRAFDC